MRFRHRRCHCIRSLGLALSAALVGCAAPEAGGSPAFLQGVERVLAVDFSAAAVARRNQRVARLPGALAAELQRVAAVPEAAPVLRRELGRGPEAGETAAAIASREARRRPVLPAGVLPSVREFGQNVADDSQLLGSLLLGGRPLPEIDDVRHRTDPQDQHPEASLWQRLRRRLRL